MGLNRPAATIQEFRRNLLRGSGHFSTEFQLRANVTFIIDKAARHPFMMFTKKHPDMIAEMDVFIELVEGKKCLIDIGAHYGIYSLAFTSLNPESSAYAIEPSPKCQKVLQLNSKYNPELKIKPYQTAFGHNAGELCMHYEWVHLIADHSQNNGAINTQLISLSQFIEQEKIEPDVIKIDVDGYEGPVVEGSLAYLKDHDPLIFLELHGDWIRRYNYKPLDIAKMLSEVGYSFYSPKLQLITDVESAFEIFANRLICMKAGKK
ncbi:MAG: FkbM family methyltransferase [Cyclobacteriaceae bacterium]